MATHDTPAFDDRVLRLGGVELNRFDLYEMAVQCPPIEAAFVRAVHGGEPRVLGEDFAGPASIARAWLAMDPSFEAVAADLDSEPLRHAVRRLTEREPDAVPRLTVRERDVLEVGDRIDALCALNFAACEIHERPRLVTYLRHVLYRLTAGGVAVFDLYTGADAMIPGDAEQVIETEQGELLYTWEQRDADVLTGRVVNAIHFGVGRHEGTRARRHEEDSSDEMRDAFVYDWRLWSVPELRDAMREAGFRTTEVYASYGEAMDEDGRLIVGEPASADDRPADEPIDGEEAGVFYVVGRV